jgi:hypothetical protein
LKFFTVKLSLHRPRLKAGTTCLISTWHKTAKNPRRGRRGLWFRKSALIEESVVRACFRPEPPKPGGPGPNKKNPAPGEGAGPGCYP